MLVQMLSNFTFLPICTPGLSASTMNPVKALPAGALGSEFVRANKKYLVNQYTKTKFSFPFTTTYTYGKHLSQNQAVDTLIEKWVNHS